MKNFLFQKRQFFFYCFIGMCGTALDFSTYSVLLHSRMLDYQQANAVGYASGTTLSFILNARFNFRVTDRIPQRVACFFGIALLGWSTSALCLHLLVAGCHYNKYLSKMAALVVVMLLQYNLNRWISFRKTN